MLLIFFMIAMFPGFAKDAAQMQKLLKGYPEAVRKAIGLDISLITSFLGFYSFTFLYVMLCAAIQAMNLGTSLLSMEIREKTADFLLTKPVTRRQILTAKLLAGLTSLLFTNIFFVGTASITASVLVEEAYSKKIFLLLSLTVVLVQLMFMALGVLVSVVVPKIKSVLSISLGTVFGLFVINLFGSIIGDEALRYITPFRYYDTMYIIKNGTYEIPFVLTEIAFIAAATTASYVLYARKDINPL